MPCPPNGKMCEFLAIFYSVDVNKCMGVCVYACASTRVVFSRGQAVAFDLIVLMNL